MPALDGAILLLSGVEGVQSHTLTIWQKLRKRNIPTLIFVNKLDRVGADPVRIYQEIRDHLTEYYVPLQRPEGLEKEFQGVVDLWQEKDFAPHSEETQQKIEFLAGLDDLLMEKFFSDQEITYQDVREGLRRLVVQGKVFPRGGNVGKVRFA